MWLRGLLALGALGLILICVLVEPTRASGQAQAPSSPSSAVDGGLGGKLADANAAQAPAPTKPCANPLLNSPFSNGQPSGKPTEKCVETQQQTTQAYVNTDKLSDMEMIADLKPMWDKFKRGGEHDLAGPMLMVHLKCESFLDNYGEKYPSSECGLRKEQITEVLKQLQREAEKGVAQAKVELAIWNLRDADSLEKLQAIKDSLTNISQADDLDKILLIGVEGRIRLLQKLPEPSNS